jgi:ketosteroid isomerase-like protein
MSQQNVELVQRAYELFVVRDLPAFFDVFDAMLTYANRADEPDARVYHGVEDFKGYIAGWLDAFDDLRFDFHEFVDLGDQIVVVTDLVGHSRT